MVEIANYPFTTIKPNRGIGYFRTQCVCKEMEVKDEPLNSICLDGTRLVPVELIDCAGLVPGAWQGRGLGNQFLDEIRKADALIHVVDISGSTSLEGKIVQTGSHDPQEDVNFLENELTMWLSQIIKKDWAKITRTVESNKGDFYVLLEERLSGLSIKRKHVISAIKTTELNPDKSSFWTEDEFIKFLSKLMKISKPMLIAANKVDLRTAEENIRKLKDFKYSVIPTCAEAELALRKAAEKQLINYKPGDSDFEIINSSELSIRQSEGLKSIREKILKKFGSTGVQLSVNVAFSNLLDMIVVYPVEDPQKLSDHSGRVLPEARLITKGTTARELAYSIHTELGENFIYAIDARTKRRLGEDHILKDRDIISIVSAKGRA